jgi:oligopeptidase A
MEANPLLGRRFRIPFAEIRAEQVEPAVDEALARARAAREALVAGPRSWDATLRALDELTLDLDYVMHVAGHLESVVSTPEIRAAYNAVLPRAVNFESEIVLDERLWRGLREYAETPEAHALVGTRRRFLQKELDDFRREGAALPPAEKKRVEELNRELAEVATRYAENVLDENGAWELWVEDERRLAGLPEAVLAATRADAEGRGRPGFRLTLHEPVYVPILERAHDAELRRTLYLAYNSRACAGERDNRPLIRRLLTLRKEKARLLGYADFADYVLEDRMAKRGEVAAGFVRDLALRTRPFFERERAELEAFRREHEGPSAPPLDPWDVPYWAERLRQARYDFDEEELRPYFALPRVLGGLFEIARRLFGVEVREVSREDPRFPGAWHPDVRYFEIHDEEGTHLASFYADLFPRDTKRGGAWMSSFLTGGPREGGFEPHLGALCANFTPPVGGRPALLLHREVETLFHELGHLLHHSLSRVEVKSLAGTHVAWDFVELPSQILENWCWEREALDLFARHHETDAPLPQALLHKMIAARNFRSATSMMRQLGFATLDLDLHQRWAGEDVLEYARRIQEAFSPVPLRPDYAMVAGFTHLFGDPVGYAAGYYSYKWAEVLDADAFTRFEREGIFNRETGRAFVEHVLSRGDSEDPGVLFARFLGRGPDPEALLRRSGLVDGPRQEFPEYSST